MSDHREQDTNELVMSAYLLRIKVPTEATPRDTLWRSPRQTIDPVAVLYELAMHYAGHNVHTLTAMLAQVFKLDDGKYSIVVGDVPLTDDDGKLSFVSTIMEASNLLADLAQQDSE